MPSPAAISTAGQSPFEQLRLAREVLQQESAAVAALADTLDDRFIQATQLLRTCQGSVIVSGMGKAGLIGQKIAATLASTGTRSHFLHPAEAIHGDLGRVSHNDVALVLSYSGQTGEVLQILPPLKSFGVDVIAITGRGDSTLAEQANVVLELGDLCEAGSLGIAPTTSTTAMLALGDALAMVVSQARQFAPEDFARFHPGGSLGRKLAKVEDAMRPLEDCRMAEESSPLRKVLVQHSRPGRRTGAIMLINQQHHLTGLFTDSDLARLFEFNRDDQIDGPISAVMTANPVTVPLGTSLQKATDLMSERKLSELPVVDQQGIPVGLLDVTDILGYAQTPSTSSTQQARWMSPDTTPTLAFQPDTDSTEQPE